MQNIPFCSEKPTNCENAAESIQASTDRKTGERTSCLVGTQWDALREELRFDRLRSDGSASPPRGKGVTLIVRNWPSHAMIEQMVKILLEEMMGFEVGFYGSASGGAASYHLLKAGYATMEFECWSEYWSVEEYVQKMEVRETPASLERSKSTKSNHTSARD